MSANIAKAFKASVVCSYVNLKAHLKCRNGMQYTVYTLELHVVPLTREKSELQAELDSVYLENIGEDILFLWVEKVNTLIKYLEEVKFISLMTLSAPLSLTQNLT